MNMFPIISALQEAQGGLIDAMFKCSFSELNTALHKAQLAINKHNRYLRFWRDTSYLEGLANQTKMAMMVATAYVLFGNKFSSALLHYFGEQE